MPYEAIIDSEIIFVIRCPPAKTGGQILFISHHTKNVQYRQVLNCINRNTLFSALQDQSNQHRRCRLYHSY